MSQLSETILSGTFEEVARLVSRGENVNAQDKYGYTPLIQAAIKENTEIAAFLLQHGAKIDQEDIVGNTALHWAVDTNNLQLTKLLLNNGANPNHYSVDGQPILVNAKLHEQQDILELLVEHGADIQFAKDYINGKLIGHRFELNGKTDIINARGRFIELDFEGFVLGFTIGIIRDSLVHFVNSPTGRKFPKLHMLFHKVIRNLLVTDKLIPPIYKRKMAAHTEKITPLLKQDFLIIPVAYQGHAITFVKCGNLLAKCDRGVHNYADTVVIYKVKNPYALNVSFLRRLIYENHTHEFINQEFKELLSLTPLVTLPTPSQISGNCSFANVEASVPAALYMLLYTTQGFDRTETTQTKNYIMKFLDSWVEWDKDRAIDNCIEQFHQANKPRQAAKAAQMAAVLFQRTRPTHKREISRAKKILAILSIEDFKYIIKSYIDVYNSPQGGKSGVQLMSVLEICHFNSETLRLDQETFTEVTENFTNHQELIQQLHTAAVKGEISVLNDILKNPDHINVDEENTEGSTALMHAAYHGQLEVVRYLIEVHDANPLLLNDKGGSALRYALYAKHQSIVDYLTTV